jgi:hypothetical protein
MPCGGHLQLRMLRVWSPADVRGAPHWLAQYRTGDIWIFRQKRAMSRRERETSFRASSTSMGACGLGQAPILGSKEGWMRGNLTGSTRSISHPPVATTEDRYLPPTFICPDSLCTTYLVPSMTRFPFKVAIVGP